MTLLEVEEVTKNFGGLTAVNEFGFRLEEGEILGLVGPNGAGKTTVFNLISGVDKPDGGRILFKGEDITGLKSHGIAAKGIGRTFQISTLFRKCTVLENVIMAHHCGTMVGLWGALFRTRAFKKEEGDIRKNALDLLESLGLSDFREMVADNLPHGYQSRLGIAIAIAIKPHLLLLDEPFAGMEAEETQAMMSLARRIRDKGTSVLLIEHDMKAVMGLCERIVVLNYGKKLAEGTPEEIQGNKEVIEAYLGAEDDVT